MAGLSTQIQTYSGSKFIQSKINMEDFSNCSKCLVSTQEFLALKCTHNLCLPCARKLIKRLLKFKTDGLTNICCQVCGKYSFLSQQTVRILGEIKSVKQQDSKTKQVANSQQVSLYCFTCHSKCFTIDQYLAGSHKSHDVKNVRKAYQSLRLLLESTLEKVRGKVDQTVSDVSKITILKRNCLQQLAQLKLKMKINFSKLKKLIQDKQIQFQKESQQLANKNLQQLQRNILHIQNLGQALEESQLKIRERLKKETPSIEQIIESFNFYSMQRQTLLQRMKLANNFNLEQLFKKYQFSNIFNFDSIFQKFQILKLRELNFQQKDFSMHYSNFQQKDSFKSGGNTKNTISKTLSSPSLRQDLEASKISQIFKNFRQKQLTGRCERISHQRKSTSPIQYISRRDLKQNRTKVLDQRINKLRKLIQS